MPRQRFSVLGLFLGFAFAQGSFVGAGEPVPTHRVEPGDIAVRPGEPVTAVIRFTDGDGWRLAGWNSSITRKAAPELFNHTLRTIRPHATNGDYDSIQFVPYTGFSKPLEKGEEAPITLGNFDDFDPGVYPVNIACRFLKDGAVHDAGYTVTLTVPAPAGEAAGGPLSGYSIYLAPDAPPSAREAAKELKTYAERAGGARLPVVFAPASPMIAVGDTPEGRAAGLSPEALSYSEYAIRTVGPDIFIVGRDLPEGGRTPQGGESHGTLWGVYAFLQDVLDVRWLLPGPLGEDVPLLPAGWRPPELDRRGKPFFRSSLLFPAVRGVPEEYLQRNGYKGTYGLELPYHSNHAWHPLYPPAAQNKDGVLKSREDTFRDNPEFFELGANGNRVQPVSGENFSLCLSAPGINEDIANRILARARKEAPLKVFPISPNDGAPWCACKPCQGGFEDLPKERTGELTMPVTRSSTPLVLAYYRKVSELVKAADPEILLTGYIYYANEFPPAAPPPPMPDNFIAVMAPLHTGYGPGRLYDGVADSWRRWRDAWRGVFRNRGYYGLDFYLRQTAGAPTSPYPAMMRETFDWFKEEGENFVTALFYPNNGIGRSAVNLWVLLRMMDNPSRDPSALMDEFFRRAYGEAAAKPIRDLYDLCEAEMKRHYTERKAFKVGWDLSAAMLAGVYAPRFAEMERLYLDALPGADTPARAWRLSMLGENLKLLRYHLEHLGLAPEAPDSPLHMGDAGYLDQVARRQAGGDLFGYVDAPIASTFLKDILRPLGRVEKAKIPEKIRARRPAFNNRHLYHNDFLLRAPRDMTVVIAVEYNNPKSPHHGDDIPYYSVYNAAGNLHFSGIALNGELRFDAKKDQNYFVVFMPQGPANWDQTYRVRACNVPFAAGEGTHVALLGGIMLREKGTLYFEAPEGLPSISFVTRGQPYVLALVDSKGKKTEIKGSGYQKTDIAAPPGGWWRLDYDVPRREAYIRSPELTGFWCPEPDLALSVSLAQ